MKSNYKQIITTIFLIVAGVFLIYAASSKLGTRRYSFNNPKTPEVAVPKTTTIFFGGDIMLSRNVEAKIAEANDYTLPFENLFKDISNADISFANLESPFNDIGDHSVEGSLIFNANPQSIQGLTKAGFDVLSTANNHALDQGTKGIDFTINHLIAHGILPIGTFASTDSNHDYSQNVIKRDDTTYGFLSYSYTALNDGGKTTSPQVADLNNLPKLKQDIVKLKGHFADVVIVNMHAGIEYTRTPSKAQIEFAHAAIDAGADLVIGEHPHWVQTIEQYKGKWIFYSLGNLVFDQMWSTDTRQGLTLLVTYEQNEIQKIELRPIIIDNFCCPRWADRDETKSIINKIHPTGTSTVIYESGKTTADWQDTITTLNTSENK